eukprot:EC716868.1.p2 GENE.EC716868.1~~EC716868.1.p2  ORF type:complete len:199 (+),score=38.68 EC716868.1:44-640(+)
MSYTPLREEEEEVIRQTTEKTPYGQPPSAPASQPQQGLPMASPVFSHNAYSSPVVATIAPQPPRSVVQIQSVHEHEIGTPGEFMCFYLISLFFGVIGFLVSLCVASTHAARLGARAGFCNALLISGMYLLFTYTEVEETMQTASLFLGVLFTIVGLMGLGGAMRAWRRVRKAYIAQRMQQQQEGIPMQPCGCSAAQQV